MERLERVQHKFLMWLTSRSNAVAHSLTYEQLLQTFEVSTLKARRLQYDKPSLSAEVDRRKTMKD